MITPELKQPPTVLVGKSKQMEKIRDFAAQAAESDLTVLLLGENGCGKDYIAKKIHELGRVSHPFVSVDCGGLTESLAETELFGHTRGAFTGATEERQSLIQVANKGTIYFDEIGNIPPSLQPKFLRIFEKKPFRAVGGTREYPFNARIIAATNANLERGIQRGEFRLDLWHRLSMLPFSIPPLRERMGDIPVLVDYFLQQKCAAKRISPEALTLLMGYSWPGNVRELESTVLRASFLSGKNDIDVEHIQLLSREAIPKGDIPLLNQLGGTSSGVFPTWDEMEREYFSTVLKKYKGNVQRAARASGLTRRAFSYQVKKLKLDDLKDSLREIEKGEVASV